MKTPIDKVRITYQVSNQKEMRK